ncbi:ion channel protein, partial [Cystoisospora suis]
MPHKGGEGRGLNSRASGGSSTAKPLRSSRGDLESDLLRDRGHSDRRGGTTLPDQAGGEIPGIPSTVTTAATCTPEGEGRGQNEGLTQVSLAAVVGQGGHSAWPGERKGDRKDQNTGAGEAPGSMGDTRLGTQPGHHQASTGTTESVATTTFSKGHEDGVVSPGKKKKKGGKGGGGEGGGGGGGRGHEVRRVSSTTSSETSSDDFLMGERRPVSPEDMFASSYIQAQHSIFTHPDRPLILICGWPKFLGRLLMKIQAIGGWNVVILTAE